MSVFDYLLFSPGNWSTFKLKLWLSNPREALISRPDELSYGVINIQATKVRLCSLATVLIF